MLLAEGELLNLFDLVVVDGIWWRRSARVRLPGISGPVPYQDMRPHVGAFGRGVVLFAVAALAASLACTAILG